MRALFARVALFPRRRVWLLAGLAWLGATGAGIGNNATAAEVAGNAASAAGGEGVTRTYYVAAEEVAWNYAPGGNAISHNPLDLVDSDVWTKRGPAHEPPAFRKVVYHEYTDATFATPKKRDPDSEYLGLLGPLIRAEVGDHLLVVLKNKALIPVSLHPHGVFYDKAGEGARYIDGTSGADLADDSVAPGKTYTYKWEVPERAGPGPADPSSVVWLYHSHVDSLRDINSGLVGAIVVTRHGMAKPDGSPKDVDREFVTLFHIFDEATSHYAVINARLFPPGTMNALADKDEKMPAMAPMDGGSMYAGTADANRFFAINGYIFGNLPMMRMHTGERVRWYLIALGGESDLHTPHWHGNVVLWDGHRTDVIDLLPASMKVADMIPDSPGIWMYHCHVEDHMMAGMTARYEVLAK